MVHVVFVDGTEESFESCRQEYEYDAKTKMFKIWNAKSGWIMIPRDFVRYIEVIRVDVDIDSL